MDTQLSIVNICQGAVPEVFARELAEVFENITDVNTVAEKKRRIVLTFEFSPYKDRSGASVSLQCKSALSSVEAIEGTIYLARQGGKLTAFTRDVRQELLFPGENNGPSSRRDSAPQNAAVPTSEDITGE
jgi:hypothetical protein